MLKPFKYMKGNVLNKCIFHRPAYILFEPVRWAQLFCALLALTACGGPTLTRQDMVSAYQEALVSTASRARGDWHSDPEALDEAIDRIQAYYHDMDSLSVERMTDEIYAADAFLCDTLHIARGSDEIKAYFLKTVSRVNTLTVNILDHSSSGGEVYTRWTMSISADKLADGRLVTTYGVSHFRFDREGKVILHQDFWDASTGFFELLPGFGRFIPRVRGRL